MLYLIHGDHQPHTRQALTSQLATATRSGRQIKTILGKSTTRAEIEQVLGTTELFGEKPLIVVESLFAMAAKKKLADILSLLNQETTPALPEPEVILWEAKTLTATQLKQLPQAKVAVFPVSKPIFTWVGSLTPLANKKATMLKAFDQAVTAEAPIFCLAMAVRQIRLLLQSQLDGSGSPRITSQAKQFQQSQLIAALTALSDLDYAHKSGNNRVDLRTDLDLWQLKL